MLKAPRPPDESGFVTTLRRVVSEEGDGDTLVDTAVRPSERAFPPRSDVLAENPPDELRTVVDAMNAFKRSRRLACLTWEEVLGVFHDLGYRKTAAPASDGPT